MSPANSARSDGGPRGRPLLTAGALMCACATVLVFISSLTSGVANVPPPAASVDALAAPVSVGAQGNQARAMALPRAEPTRLVVPALRIDAALGTVGRTEDGQIGTPDLANAAQPAWYRGSHTPGELGTAVIVGHVDSRSGPGVFFELSTLEPGDGIEIARAEGSVAVFTVDAIREYSKGEFPAREIFAPHGFARLVLITCGGQFDRQVGYDSNIIVYAHLTPPSG